MVQVAQWMRSEDDWERRVGITSSEKPLLQHMIANPEQWDQFRSGRIEPKGPLSSLSSLDMRLHSYAVSVQWPSGCDGYATLEDDAITRDVMHVPSSLSGKLLSPSSSTDSVGSVESGMRVLGAAAAAAAARQQQQQQRKKRVATHRELRGLIPDLSSRGKYTEDERDFTCFLGRALQELSAAGCAWPFSRPVRRREAQDYYDRIEMPMDLMKMRSKLKEGKYTSKAKFQEDLELIVSNCLRYNPAVSVSAHPPICAALPL